MTTDLNSLFVGGDVRFYGFMFLCGGFNGLEVITEVILQRTEERKQGG